MSNERLLVSSSLVANLGAANLFTIDHLDVPKNQQLIDQAKIFYTAVSNRTVLLDVPIPRHRSGIFLRRLSTDGDETLRTRRCPS